MIKLTINPNEKPLVKTFDQKVITIGSGKGSIKVDLCLSDHELKPIHMKIIEDGNRFLVINLANDPFVTLNGLPFGKKGLKNKDLLQVGSSIILFETNSTPLDNSQDISHNKNTENKINDSNLQNLSPEMEQFAEKSLKESNLREIEKPVALISSTNIEEISQENSISSGNKKPLEYHVGEFDDENESWTPKGEPRDIKDIEPEPPARIINWKMLGAIAFSTVFIFFLTTVAIYFNIRAKNAQEELKAAEGVADVAMALKYAQIHHIKPVKKNWSDPEFIKNSLAQIIPNDYISLAKIDHQGHLNDTSYSLRIYTNSDFSQFIVIAQPAPSVLQWLTPKIAIVIDSKLMQLKKVVDMKTLNRLLVNSNNLDNSNAIEVTHLVKRSELIPLNKLALNRPNQDFSPPKALSLLRPGAENYIYNAPRYYLLGETIMKRAIDLMEMPGSVYEMSRLKQDMSLLSKMHDMVLYSSEGIQLTLDAQKSISAFVANARFLTAYLKYNSEGKIVSSHLIIDDEGSHYQIPETPKNTKKIPLQEVVDHANVLAEMDQKTVNSEDPIEEHPLLTQFISLLINRKSVLSPLKDQMIGLLEEDLNHPVDEFKTSFEKAIREYQDADVQQKSEMAKAIHQLSEEYQLMSLNDFMTYLKKAGIGESCKEILKYATDLKDQNEILENFTRSIQLAENFKELDHILNQTNHWLVVKNFCDLNLLQDYRQLIKNEAISQINKLLLSSSPTPLTLHYDDEQRTALQHTLELLLENIEEQTYYLTEFDFSMKKE